MNGTRASVERTVSRCDFLRLSVAGFAGVTMLGIAGCGSMGGGSGGEKVIGFSQAALNHPWRVAMLAGNKEYAEKHLPNIDLVYTDGQNSPSKQVTDVESLLARSVAVLMISPVEAEALTPIVKRAMDEGTPVVTLDRKVNTPVTQHIGAKNEPIGREAADFISEELGGEGNIIELQGTAGASATIERHEGFAKQLEAEHPDLKVIANEYADYQRAPAQTYMDDMLQRFGSGEIQAVYAHNDEMALGAVQALEAANRLDEVKVVGIDGQNSAFKAVKAGRLAATFIYPFCAPEGVQQAAKIAQGKDVSKELVLEHTRVDSSNVEKYLGKGF